MRPEFIRIEAIRRTAGRAHDANVDARHADRGRAPRRDDAVPRAPRRRPEPHRRRPTPEAPALAVGDAVRCRGAAHDVLVFPADDAAVRRAATSRRRRSDPRTIRSARTAHGTPPPRGDHDEPSPATRPHPRLDHGRGDLRRAPPRRCIAAAAAAGAAACSPLHPAAAARQPQATGGDLEDSLSIYTWGDYDAPDVLEAFTADSAPTSRSTPSARTRSSSPSSSPRRAPPATTSSCRPASSSRR